MLGVLKSWSWALSPVLQSHLLLVAALSSAVGNGCKSGTAQELAFAEGFTSILLVLVMQAPELETFRTWTATIYEFCWLPRTFELVGILQGVRPKIGEFKAADLNRLCFPILQFIQDILACLTWIFRHFYQTLHREVYRCEGKMPSATSSIYGQSDHHFILPRTALVYTYCPGIIITCFCSQVSQ